MIKFIANLIEIAKQSYEYGKQQGEQDQANGSYGIKGSMKVMIKGAKNAREKEVERKALKDMD